MVFNWRWGAIACALLTLVACGHRKAPSGGPVDTTPPEILAIDPSPLEQLDDKITITFSKPIDRKSALTGVKLYPPVINRRFRWPEQQTMVIDIREGLDENTNYTLWLGPDLKDTHGNTLEQPATYVFRHGELQSGRIAGSFVWDDPVSSGLPVHLDLFTADTTFIAGWELSQPTFALEHLNVEPHLLRAWADVDENGKYRYGKDLRAEATAPSDERVSLDLAMAVEDTLAPNISRIVAGSERQATVYLSEPVEGYTTLELFSADSLIIAHDYSYAVLRDDELRLLMSPTPEGRYMVKLTGLRDSRGNRTALDSLFFDARATPDTLAPKIVAFSPRNGAVLREKRPLFTVQFSEIIPADSIAFRFFEDESGADIPFAVEEEDGDIYTLRPSKALDDYIAYRLEIIRAADAAGNRMTDGLDGRWIYIPPREE